MTKNEKSGISLLTLIIVIIVLVILATAIIITLRNINIVENSKMAKFSNEYKEIEEGILVYKSNKMLEIKENKSKETLLPISNQVTTQEKINIENEKSTLKTIIEEITGKILEEVNLYWIDNELLGTKIKDKYIIDIDTNKIYKYEGEIIYEKVWHTLDKGIEDLNNIFSNIKIKTDTNNLCTELNVTIEYGDSSIRQYKIGESNTTWLEYTGVINLTSDTVIANSWENEDNTVTVYAKGEDKNGDEEIKTKVISNLDIIFPNEPVIISNYGYPVLTAYGMQYNGNTTIKYDTIEGITNFYSLDNGTTWNEYKGSFDVIETCTIIAKSVKPSGLETMVTKNITTPTDGLEYVAFDENETTYISSEKTVKKFYMYVDSDIIGSKMVYKYTAAGGGSSGQSTVKVELLDENDKVLDSYINTSTVKTITQKEMEILPSTVRVLFTISYDSGWGSSSNSALYEVGISDEPILNIKDIYPLLTQNGVVYGYEEISIDYFLSSIEKLYKIDDGEWNNYEGALKLELGKTIYAKGIDKFGEETEIVSHTSDLAEDALPTQCYDEDETTYILSEKTVKKFYMYIDSDIIGSKMVYKYTAAGGGSSGQSTVKVELLDENDKVLDSYINTSTVKTITQKEMEILPSTVRVLFTISYDSGWGSSSNSALYEVGMSGN